MTWYKKALLRLSATLGEPYLEPEKITTYINGYFSPETGRNTDKSIEKLLTDFGRDLGVIFNTWQKGDILPLEKDADDAYAEVQNWLEQAEDERIIHKGVLMAGGAAKLGLLSRHLPDENAMLRRNMEFLLRHVEVKRADALKRYEEALAARELWIERCSYSILFSQIAFLWKDWRFLNAGLKLNEYLWKDRNKSYAKENDVLFILALLEQENAFKEMNRCCG
jgi:hypothetical protein